MPVRPLVPVLGLLACLTFGTGARAGEPQTAATDEGAYQQERSSSTRAKVKADAPPPAKFEREGCMADPSKCRCQSTDKGRTEVCSTMLGYFCPDSTLRVLASSCMDLFGGATLCQCAAAKQIESHIKAEDAAKAKAEKKAKAKKKPAKAP